MDSSKGKSTMATVNVETLLGCGCFQAFIFLSLQWVGFVQASNMLFMVFGKATPSQWACMDDGVSIEAFENGTKFNESLQCSAVDAGTCNNFTWRGPFYSIVPHWQLVCGRAKYVYLIMTLQMLGAVFGSPVFGQLSDTFGRKWTLVASIAILLASGAASAFAPSWHVLAALRFVVGFSAGGCIITNHVFTVEFLTRKHRLWVTNVAGWAISYMFLDLIAYTLADWRKLAIITNALGIPALGITWYIGESPRWLIQTGRIAEAEKQLRRIARLNRQVIDDEEVRIVLHGGKAIVQDLSVEAEKLSAPPTPVLGQVSKPAVPSLPQTKRYTYWHLFATKKLSAHLIILSMTYFCISVISGGITFNVDKLSGSLFVNFALMGGTRWLSNLATVGADLLIKKFGRRYGLIIPFFCICVCSTAVTLTYLLASNVPQLKTIIVVMSMVMSVLCPPIWMMVYLSNTELFPTPIRNMSHAFTSTFNRLGGVVAPQVLYLAHFWTPAPFAIFAGLSLIAGILFAIFIPETKGKPLPEKMPERRGSTGSILAHLRRRRSRSSTSNHENKPDLTYYLVEREEVKVTA